MYFPLAETAAKTGMIMLLGEISSKAHVDYQKVVRDTIKHIGYDDSAKGNSFSYCATVWDCLSTAIMGLFVHFSVYNVVSDALFVHYLWAHLLES